MTLAANTCARCQKQIGSQIVRPPKLDGAFHPDCFTCIDCNELVAARFFPDDQQKQPLCEYDYFRRKDLLCGTCNMALRGTYIKALDKKFHIEHFRCSACSLVFGPEGEYYEHEGQVYCHFHYSMDFAAPCAGCQHAILKQYVEIVDKNVGQIRRWHPDCYRVHKYWNIKVTRSDDALRTRSTKPEDGDHLKRQQQTMEDKVGWLQKVLSTFEESSAGCISDMLLHVSGKSYEDGIRLADCLLLHIEAVFLGVDALCRIQKSLAKVDSYDRNKEFPFMEAATPLCNKIILFFKFLESKKLEVDHEAISLVAGLASYLKKLVRVALKEALRLDETTGTALKVFLEKLFEVTSRGYAGRDQYHLSDLKGASTSCRVCAKVIESECVKYDNYRWHTICFRCGECHKALAPEKGAQLCSNEVMPRCGSCAGYNRNVTFQTFESISNLDQYAFLLRLELSKLCERLQISDLSTSTPDAYFKYRQSSEKDLSLPEPRQVRSSYHPEPIQILPDIPPPTQLNRRVSRSLKSPRRSTAVGSSPNTTSEAVIPEGSTLTPTSIARPRRLESLQRRLGQQKETTVQHSLRQRPFPPVPSLHMYNRSASPAPSKTQVPAGRTRIPLCELSAMQYMIIRHAAALHIAEFVKSEFSQKELRNMIVTKKSSIWGRVFTSFKAKRTIKDGTFGVPLDVLTERTGVESNLGIGPSPIRIAAFIDDAITTMRQMDMSVEGVFRKNGNIRGLRELTEQLDRNPQDVDLSSETVIQIAALLKKFLREMPDPLLTHRLFSLFLCAAKLQPDEARTRVLHLVCCMLPQCNRNTMEALFLFLRWAAGFSQVTTDEGSLMDISNLARVIAPNILAPKPPAKEEPNGVIEVIKALLDDYEEFCLVPEPLERYLQELPPKGGKPESVLKQVEQLMAKGVMSVSMPDLSADLARQDPSLPGYIRRHEKSIYTPQQHLPFENHHPQSDYYRESSFLRQSSLTQNTSQSSLPLPQM